MNARRVTWLLVAALVVYLVLVGSRGVLLVGHGGLVAVLLGVGVLLLPVVGAAVIWFELRFGFAVQRMARVLEAEGGLPVDELSRSAAGRVQVASADAVFARRRAEVEAAPGDWRAWYRLGVAYADARDTRRGRAAMRQAARLFAAAPEGRR